MATADPRFDEDLFANTSPDRPPSSGASVQPEGTTNMDTDTAAPDVPQGGDTRFGDLEDDDENDVPKTEDKPKKVNRARLEFDTFVGTKVTETEVKEEGIEGIRTARVEEHYDHFWESLFLKRVALFPSLDDATMQADKRVEEGGLTPVGTTPWFEDYRPLDVDPAVFHMERLLLRIREWSQEVRHVKHDLMSFAEKIQGKTANVKSVELYANHRYDMIKRFLNENWMEQALDHIQKEVSEKEDKKRNLIENRHNENLEILRNIGRAQENLNENPDMRSSSNSQSNSFATNLKNRQEIIKEKRRQKEREEALASRRAKILEKRRQKRGEGPHLDEGPPLNPTADPMDAMAARKAALIAKRNERGPEEEEYPAPPDEII